MDEKREKQGKKEDKNEGSKHLYLMVYLPTQKELGQNKKTRGKTSTLLFFLCASECKQK